MWERISTGSRNAGCQRKAWDGHLAARRERPIPVNGAYIPDTGTTLVTGFGVQWAKIGGSFMPLSPGVRIGPYEILVALGAGGMGEVYNARDAKLDREVTMVGGNVPLEIPEQQK